MSDSAEAPVLLDIADGVATVTLNRPERSNAFDLPMAREIARTVDRLREDDVRVVVVRGAGKRFCAGGDVTSFLGSDDAQAKLHELAELAESGLRGLGELPKPVVVGVHGAVAGAGLSFVLNADIAVAARGTKFVAAYPGVGLTPDAGVSWLLPRVVGQQRALKHLLANEPLSGEDACAWGLVAEVVDTDDDVVRRTDELAARLAALSPSALAAAKRMVKGSWATTREENAVEEADSIAHQLGTPEAQAAIAGFTKA
ncbi:MAG: enoyl-CoA hydratase/isomerase family protein [Candidatus Nanopelagicales bacterium]